MTQIFVPLSFGSPATLQNIAAYLPFLFLAGFFASFFVLKWIKKSQHSRDGKFLPLILAVIIMIALVDFALAYYHFTDLISLKIFQLAMALLFITGVTMAGVRFVIQFSLEGRNRLALIWKLAGSVTIGIALAGLPYVMIFSITDLPALFENDVSGITFIPFSFQLLIMILLFLLPDLLREKQIVEQEKRMEEHIHNYEALFNHHPNPVFLLGKDGSFLNANHEFISWARLPKESIIGSSILNFVAEKDTKRAMEYIVDSFKGNANHFEISGISSRNYIYETRVTSIPMWSNEQITGVYGIVQDITEAKANEKKITYLAYHDELTGLPTRRAFFEKISSLETAYKEQGDTFAVLYIDLDKFKELNDLFGHSYGDEALKEAVLRIKPCLPEGAFLARMGGDEFSLLLPGMTSNDQIGKIAASIVENIRKPFIIDKHEYFLTASVGAAIYPRHGNNQESILKSADTAMYHAKENGKNNYKMFSDELAQSTRRKYIVGNELRNAIIRKEFDVYYQPKVTLTSGEISGAEALVRWIHPKIGIIGPNEFIPIAEENGLIIEIEDIVIEKVLRQLKSWNSGRSKALPAAINLSQRHFYQENIVAKFKALLHEYELDPNLVEIEITESIMMDQNPAVITRLHELRDLGLKISMDDFGTGYSSLSYIKRLPIDKLKIDRSFIMDLSDNEDSQAIVSLILSMAEYLKLEVVAEGIEDQQQLQYLQNLKCSEGQGFLFSKPLAINDFQELLKQTADL
ncbi:putative bifunctional diguanylate cyclase/phosphodiesterase [Peribacillus glennii]|uniref:EAL domain-containing protein n=1 Tax=Peribacillus glennii TaxID=2303991 RepID=A0A372LJG4_9BACI|nr:GGDEF and EAL domain-containing protein [Peribacillus glennii]RFU66565.1 EAL domain-containing protein [Peribacillus glennii]